MPRKRPQITPGEKFGRLTAMRPTSGEYWEFVCDCGNTKVAAGGSIRGGSIKSCGCLKAELARASKPWKRRHGHATNENGRGTLTYKSWAAMNSRCRRPSSPDYARYSGRGITVAERWLSFENFLADMGERPPGTSLDRINNDGNYEPGNCRWANYTEQGNNNSRNVHLTHNGETKTLAEWCRTTSITEETVRSRIKRGWELERALSEPLKRKQRAA